jgi:phosphoribosylformimino-5-aminoimidazole carboxamide ribotide isomerase
MFEIIPAIDIRAGRCVRLYQGDYAQETVFSDDPVDVARRWESAGVPRIHLVDLDGAAEGRPVNSAVIKAIAAAVSVPLELGGGMRTLDIVASTFDLGVERVILGTVAVEDPGIVGEAAAKHGPRIAVGVDARDGWVATRGWKSTERVSVLDLVAAMERLGVSRFIYTDIARDGTLTSPNFQAMQDLASRCSGRVIASGGVASIDHLRRLARLGLEGAIVGRAAYTGDVDIAAAVAAARAEGW